MATSTKIMTSPVAFGLDPAVAKKLGWDKKAPTWSEIARAAGQKKFRYGMSNPATSNPAFAALANVATALADTGAALKAEADRRGGRRPAAVLLGAVDDRGVGRLTWPTGSSASAGKPGAPQGLINYESTLIALNESGRLKKPLTVVIPADGVISADFPMTPAQRRSARRPGPGTGRSPTGCARPTASRSSWTRPPGARSVAGSSPTRRSSVTSC